MRGKRPRPVSMLIDPNINNKKQYTHGSGSSSENEINEEAENEKPVESDEEDPANWESIPDPVVAKQRSLTNKAPAFCWQYFSKSQFRHKKSGKTCFRVKCGIEKCKVTYAYHNSTTRMNDHLKSSHLLTPKSPPIDNESDEYLLTMHFAVTGSSFNSAESYYLKKLHQKHKIDSPGRKRISENIQRYYEKGPLDKDFFIYLGSILNCIFILS